MRFMSRRLPAAVSGAFLAWATGSAALADDTEIFFNQSNTGANANVLLILDTSGSMNSTVSTAEPYDGSKTYTADKCATAFDSNAYYFGTKTPACGSSAKIDIKQFKCANIGDLAKSKSGYYTGTFAQWGSSVTSKTSGKGKVKSTITTTTYGWNNTLGAANTTGYVECKDDAGIDGDGVDKTKLFPSTDTFSVIVTTDSSGVVTGTSGSVSGNQLTGVWDATKNWWTANSGGAYTVYSGNYLNYFYDSSQSTTQSKIHIMQEAAESLLNSVGGINVGLMRYNFGGAGGMVLSPVADIASNKSAMTTLINNWAPNGITPLSETLYESYLYLSGGAVNFGKNSTSSNCLSWDPVTFTCLSANSFPAPSVAASRTPATSTGANYNSPSDFSCQKNYIVYLTDGLPNEADKADAAIKALPDFAALGGSCDATAFSGATGGLCTAALAKYMNNADLRADVDGKQNVTSYFIGFGTDFASGGAPTAAFTYLDKAATAGGGKAYSATSLTELTTVFSQIFSEVLKTNTLFSAPAVAVNAFNRTQTRDDIYVSVFSPKSTFHWPGNVKKYKIANVNGQEQIVDANGVPAVDAATGFFKDGVAQSFWSAVVDGADVTLGGAASNIPIPAKRHVYIYKGANPTSPTALTALNITSVTDADLNIGGVDDPDIADLVNWALGTDVLDDDNDKDVTEARHVMGDPIHAQPTVVVYGKNSDGTDDAVVFVPTNDGYFHAVDTNTGIELWSFIPQEMLPFLKDLYANGAVNGKHYGLDGAVAVLKFDINGDGTIDAAAGDRVILYFGTGRNASNSNYYALDVTDKTSPKFMWSIDASVLPGLGQAWSIPTIARVNVQGATQNSQKLALIIGGGYDAAEDNYNYVNADGVGTHLYMVDALRGSLLWAAGPASATGVNFIAPRMDHAIPSTVTVMDTDVDGFADRMYVGDMAGQLWRFDIFNGQSADTLVTGGVVASLGAKDESTRTLANTRRFYNAPDVAAVQTPGVSPYLNIAIGSGYRGHPLETATQDTFYALRDFMPFGKMTQAQYDSHAMIVDSGSSSTLTSSIKLVDITSDPNPTLPTSAAGWQLLLNQHGGWVGEKVLSAARTFDQKILFTTYTPNTGDGKNNNPCAGVGTGTNRVYVVGVGNGSAILDKNKDGIETADERSTDLSQGGIAPQTAFLFPPETGGGSGGSGGSGSGSGTGQVVCLSGVEVLSVCNNFNQRRKTYWREGGAN